MATVEEKQELVDNLKGKRFYRFMLWGYGGEAAYLPLNKEQYDFWNTHNQEHGDSDLVNYMVSSEEKDYDFEDLDVVPKEADFMMDENGEGCPWYEHHDELEHQYGVDYGNARITIEEVDSGEWDGKVLNTIVDGTDLSEYINKIDEENNYEIELHDAGVSGYEEWDAEYICQFYSAEKGTFFEGLIETVGEFDPKKLKIYTLEYANGDDTVENVEYNGEDVDNGGGDTNGKGYSAHIWKN